MNVQDAKELTITEGEVRTIHDSNGKELWGKVNYTTSYNGDAAQQTYTGKNKMPVIAGSASLNGIDITIDTEGVITINGTSTDSLNIKITNGVVANVSSTIPSSWLNDSIGDVNNKTLSIIYQSGTFASLGVAWRIFENTTSYSYQWYPSSSTITQSFTSSQTMSCFVFFIGVNKTFTDYKVKVQLEDGTTPTSYEPYVGGVPAPNPSYPQTINVVTGTQTITLSDGVVSDGYTVSLGSIELCKIGEYQDYIYKSGNDWYVHKEIGKYTFTSSDNWGSSTYGTNSWILDNKTVDYSFVEDKIITACDFATSVSYNNRATGDSTQTTVCYLVSNGTINIRNTTITAKADMQAATNGKNLYYTITPINTQITDTSLIAQLEAINEWLTRYGYTASVVGNLPIVIERTTIS